MSQVFLLFTEIHNESLAHSGTMHYHIPWTIYLQIHACLMTKKLLRTSSLGKPHQALESKLTVPSSRPNTWSGFPSVPLPLAHTLH